MAYYSNAYDEKNSFQSLKNSVSNMSNNMAVIITTLEKSIKVLDSNFVIDGVSLAANRLRNIKNNLQEKHSYLNGAIMNSINSEIANFDSNTSEFEEQTNSGVTSSTSGIKRDFKSGRDTVNYTM